MPEAKISLHQFTKLPIKVTDTVSGNDTHVKVITPHKGLVRMEYNDGGNSFNATVSKIHTLEEESKNFLLKKWSEMIEFNGEGK